jgi:tripartite-type tricarboxylate transporter receptor subunit TctC
MPEMRAFLKANSFEPDSMPPQEFAKLIKSDLQYWSELINVVGAKIE